MSEALTEVLVMLAAVALFFSVAPRVNAWVRARRRCHGCGKRGTGGRLYCRSCAS